MWDVASDEELLSLYGNTSNVFGVSFSLDDQQLATAGADGTIRTYSLQLEELVTRLNSVFLVILVISMAVVQFCATFRVNLWGNSRPHLVPIMAFNVSS